MTPSLIKRACNYSNMLFFLEMTCLGSRSAWPNTLIVKARGNDQENELERRCLFQASWIHTIPVMALYSSECLLVVRATLPYPCTWYIDAAFRSRRVLTNRSMKQMASCSASIILCNVIAAFAAVSGPPDIAFSAKHFDDHTHILLLQLDLANLLEYMTRKGRHSSWHSSTSISDILSLHSITISFPNSSSEITQSSTIREPSSQEITRTSMQPRNPRG